MEELVRRLIHEKRAKTECPPLPSEVFARYFGEEHGVDLPIESNFRFRPVSFAEED